ncbi:STAS domain-containing protein [Streptomyces sp. INA 01156]
MPRIPAGPWPSRRTDRRRNDGRHPARGTRPAHRTVLSRRLDTLADRAFPDLVLDLRAVSFIDCSGLGVLCRAATGCWPAADGCG